MTKDLLIVSIISTIVEDPDTIPMSVRHPTKEEKIIQKEVEMIVMNEEHPREVRIRKGRTSHQGATQN